MGDFFQRAWSRAWVRYTAIFVTSAFSDFWSSLYVYSITHRWVAVQALIGFFLPFINLFYNITFIETHDVKERLKLTLFCALGWTLGASLMLLWVSD